MMFKCTECGHIDSFSLMLSADYQGPGNFSQKYNEHNEIIINVDGFEFIPDLSFMNSHAVCKYCGTIKMFEYSFNPSTETENSANDKGVEVDKNPKSQHKK